MICGLEFWQPGEAKALSKQVFDNSLIIEVCGSEQNVLKLLPPLVIDSKLLSKGIGLIDSALKTRITAL